MTRLAILAPGLSGLHGHEAEYSLLIAAAAAARGASVEIVGPTNAPELACAHALRRALPPLRRSRNAASLGARALRRAETVLEAQRRSAAYRRLFAGTEARWLLHTAPYAEIELAVRAFAEAGRGRLLVVLRYDHYDVPQAIAQIRRALAPAARADIRLFADSAELQALLAPLAPVAITLAPPPVIEPRARHAAPQVGYFGAMRRQKGFHRIPTLVAATQAHAPDLSFLIQAYPHPDDPPDPALTAAHAALRGAPGVRLIEEPLASDAFHAALWSCTAILAPYEPFTYRAGTSGVAAAAIAAGATVLATPASAIFTSAARDGLTRVHALPDDDAKAGALIAASAARAPEPFTERERAWIEAASPARLAQLFLAAS